jgi:ribonuclease P protein component
MLPVAYRLRRPAEVKRVRALGRAYRHPLMVLLVTPAAQEGAPVSRFAFVASRRVGNAVKRNRCKRLLREAVRRQLPQLVAGWDCVWIARTPLVGSSFNEVETVVRQQLRRARLLHPQP